MSDSSNLVIKDQSWSASDNFRSTSRDWTLPMHTYLGPGTDVLSNLEKQIVPKDQADLLALEHDFDYITAKSVEDIAAADLKFRDNATDLESIIAGKLLQLKSFYGLDKSFVGDGLTTDLKDYYQSKMDDVNFSYNVEKDIKSKGHNFYRNGWFSNEN